MRLLLVMMLVGALSLFAAGFVHAGLRHSVDPELVLGFSYAFGGLGLTAMVAAGVALGVGLSRS